MVELMPDLPFNFNRRPAEGNVPDTRVGLNYNVSNITAVGAANAAAGAAVQSTADVASRYLQEHYDREVASDLNHQTTLAENELEQARKTAADVKDQKKVKEIYDAAFARIEKRMNDADEADGVPNHRHGESKKKFEEWWATRKQVADTTALQRRLDIGKEASVKRIDMDLSTYSRMTSDPESYRRGQRGILETLQTAKATDILSPEDAEKARTQWETKLDVNYAGSMVAQLDDARRGGTSGVALAEMAKTSMNELDYLLRLDDDDRNRFKRDMESIVSRDEEDRRRMAAELKSMKEADAKAERLRITEEDKQREEFRKNNMVKVNVSIVKNNGKLPWTADEIQKMELRPEDKNKLLDGVITDLQQKATTVKQEKEYANLMAIVPTLNSLTTEQRNDLYARIYALPAHMRNDLFTTLDATESGNEIEKGFAQSLNVALKLEMKAQGDTFSDQKNMRLDQRIMEKTRLLNEFREFAKNHKGNIKAIQAEANLIIDEINETKDLREFSRRGSSNGPTRPVGVEALRTEEVQVGDKRIRKQPHEVVGTNAKGQIVILNPVTGTYRLGE